MHNRWVPVNEWDGIDMAYKYKSPRTRGYVQFKLSKSQHNMYYPNRPLSWRYRYEYYFSPGVGIELECLPSIWLQIAALLGSPILLILHGFGHFDDFINEMKAIFFTKKYGKFVSDYVWTKHISYISISEDIAFGRIKTW